MARHSMTVQMGYAESEGYAEGGWARPESTGSAQEPGPDSGLELEKPIPMFATERVGWRADYLKFIGIGG